jgi:hypothetical protein
MLRYLHGVKVIGANSTPVATAAGRDFALS